MLKIVYQLYKRADFNSVVALHVTIAMQFVHLLQGGCFV